MKIAFHVPQISDRGTEVAVYDYALANKNILHNISEIFVPLGNIQSATKYQDFKKYFNIYEYSSIQELKTILLDGKFDLLYSLEYGNYKSCKLQSINELPVFTHCVFSLTYPHGAYYCPIHEYLNYWYGTHYPVLPHIVKPFGFTNENLRRELNIPDNSLVFGGYGGRTSFDIPLAQKAVISTARKNKNTYFIFMNFENFFPKNIASLPNIIFLPGNTSLIEKERFINTCDAMIHARKDGETFGLAVAEFSIKNKPVITYKLPMRYLLRNLIRKVLKIRSSYETAHLKNLGDAAITYKSYRQLCNILSNFHKHYDQDKNYDRFSEKYSEEKVIYIFNDIIHGMVK